MNQENSSNDAIHWADITAENIIRQKGDKAKYTLASGITPSGVVHFGNFRETITVDFIARALRKRGKEVRFIFSWDDYDTFRKVPANMPNQEKLQKYLFQPIVDTPDPFEKLESYAANNETAYEKQLDKIGIRVERIYQAKQYRSGAYKKNIKDTLKKRDKILPILNAHRTENLPADWMPISVYCAKCNRDHEIINLKYDGNDILSYECKMCGYAGEENLENTSRVKLPWRLDWPMRWAYEGVDFEPGGKDHSSEGGSYTTAKDLVKEIYGGTPPVYLQYDFVSVKGMGGKMSSSKGNLITINDVMDVYEPEMVRWIFASYKPNVDFAISFDLDVIKNYEDFDRMERLVYGKEAGNEKKVAMAKRVYELSQIDNSIPSEMPIQPMFRHLCNILQINGGNISAARNFYQSEIKNTRDERRFTERAERALFWIKEYAPEEFKFQLNSKAPDLALGPKEQSFLGKMKNYINDNWNEITDDKILHNKIYEWIKECELDANATFTLMYQLLISKDKGPKLAGFIRIIGREKILNLLSTI